ncbi:MAG: bile acid:sodium symporter [Opitutae bacterium]|nr:bile acid:sodium symporter [Opitutae bacterium]MCD8299243.1 bile acid:sodium symporter [Opitutae bacterium]
MAHDFPAHDKRMGASAHKKHPLAFFKDWFLAGMVTCVVLATLFPDVGKTGGAIHADELANWGVAAIFFFHGLGLSWNNLRNGLLAWRVHILVQAMTFVVFPILTFAFCFVAADTLGIIRPELALGFYFLGALPSTISSSVAMTAAARGNIPAAIFNASISSLLGIFLTPLLIGIFAHTTGEPLPLSQTIFDLFTLLFLPFLVGQALRGVLAKYFEPFKKYVNMFDKIVILLIVFSAFSDSVARGLWTNFGLVVLVQTGVGAAVVLFLALTISRTAARALKFGTEDEIAAVFCGSKKTLASGIPMARVIFGAAAISGEIDIGLLVLPIMFYHQLQLFVCSIIASRYAKRDNGGDHYNGGGNNYAHNSGNSPATTNPFATTNPATTKGGNA